MRLQRMVSLLERRGLLPEAGPARPLAIATFVNMIGSGTWLTGSVLFFTRSVGLWPAQVGGGISIAGVFGLLAAIPLGHLADRRGPREIAVVMLLLSGAATAGYALAHSFATFLALVTIDAVAQVGATAARSAVIAATFAGHSRGRMMAYLRAVSNLGISLGPVGTGFTLHVDTRVAYLALAYGDAATYLTAAVSLLALRRVGPRAPNHGDCPRGA